MCLLLSHLRLRFIVCGFAHTENSVHMYLVRSDTYLFKVSSASRYFILVFWFFFLFFLVGSPTVSGMSDMDYPLQGPGLLSIPNLPEISSVRRVPLPPELVEQFGRILM